MKNPAFFLSERGGPSREMELWQSETLTGWRSHSDEELGVTVK